MIVDGNVHNRLVSVPRCRGAASARRRAPHILSETWQKLSEMPMQRDLLRNVNLKNLFYIHFSDILLRSERSGMDKPTYSPNFASFFYHHSFDMVEMEVKKWRLPWSENCRVFRRRILDLDMDFKKSQLPFNFKKFESIYKLWVMSAPIGIMMIKLPLQGFASDVRDVCTSMIPPSGGQMAPPATCPTCKALKLPRFANCFWFYKIKVELAQFAIPQNQRKIQPNWRENSASKIIRGDVIV